MSYSYTMMLSPESLLVAFIVLMSELRLTIVSSLSHDTRVTLPMVIMAAIATANFLKLFFIVVIF